MTHRPKERTTPLHINPYDIKVVSLSLPLPLRFMKRGRRRTLIQGLTTITEIMCKVLDHAF